MENLEEVDEIVSALKKEIEFFEQHWPDFAEINDSKLQRIINEKQKLLGEKERIELLYNDLQHELEKKSGTVGKLQVKLFTLMTFIEFQEKKNMS